MANEVEKAEKQYQGAMARAEGLAGKLKGWAVELAALEQQVADFQEQRYGCLAQGDEAGAEKLEGQLTKAGKSAADKRVLIARQEPLVKAELERAADIWVPSAAAVYAADEAALVTIHAEFQRAEAKLANVRGRLQSAQGRLTASANFDSDARDQRNRAPWLAGEFARLTGQPKPANAWQPSWLAEPEHVVPLEPLRPVATPAMRGEAWMGDAA